MASFNRVILMGNLTRNPEVRYIPNGTPVCDIGLAVNDRRKNSAGEFVDEVTFVDVTLWNRTAEIAGEYLTKGSPVLIEGRLKLDTWETDGQKRSKLKVVADSMHMVGSRDGNRGGGGGDSSGRSGGGNRDGGSSGGAASRNTGYTPPQDDYGSGSSGGGNDDVPF